MLITGDITVQASYMFCWAQLVLKKKIKCEVQKPILIISREAKHKDKISDKQTSL